MKPLWKLRSGKFAGWQKEAALYDATGKHVGYFVGEFAYTLNGQYLGELYSPGWIGKRTHGAPPPQGAKVGYAPIASRPQVDRIGRAVDRWDDPEF